MKNLLLLLFASLLIAPSIFAQAPQGLNYQAVAYNGSGTPVTNQSISVRFSILDGSATGTLVYEETQNPTTDNTGLFSIVIGNGTVVSGTFNTINWGNGSKWLKTEIDITGGTSYLVMGTSQFMSVPYALYANTGGLGSPSFTNPDGFINPIMVVIPDSVNYTVPAGKNLYIPSPKNGVKIDNVLVTAGIGSTAIPMTFIAASENSVVWLKVHSMICFLVDKKVTWQTIEFANNSYTVPANKRFVVVTYDRRYNGNTSPTPNCQVNLNGTPFNMYNLEMQNAILEEGTSITTTGCTDPGFTSCVNGYLIDK